MKKMILVLAAGVLAACMGCPHDKYTIEMKPQGDGMVREFTLARTEDTQPSTRLADVEKLYGKPISSQPATQVFRKTFGRQMPADVGNNAGNYLRYATSLGTVSAYVERFRGSHDLAKQLQDRFAAADRIDDILIGWLGSELGKQPNWPQLKAWLDRDVRNDMKNLAVYLWGTKWHSQQFPDDLIARMGQFLIERGYVPDDPALPLIASSGDKNGDLVLRLARGKLSQRLDLKADQAKDALAFLADADACRKSFSRYVENLPEYKRFARETRKTATASEPGTSQPAEQAAPVDYIGEEMLAAWMSTTPTSTPGSTDDRLKVVLSLPGEPLKTNGKWDERQHKVTWEFGLKTLGEADQMQPPDLAYALWAEPDEKAQTKHFGKMVLQGEDLLKYAMWQSVLSPDDVKEWNAFVDSLKPGPDLEQKLTDFRFASEKDRPLPPEQLAATSVVNSILGALKAAAESASQPATAPAAQKWD